VVTYKKRKETKQEKIKSRNIISAVPTVIKFKLSMDRRYVDLRMWVSDIIPCHIVAHNHAANNSQQWK